MSFKGLLFLGAVLSPLSANAFDLSPASSDNLADPAYIPAAGETDGESVLSLNSLHEKRITPAGTMSPAYDAVSRDIGQSLVYGVTDRFSLSLSDSYRTVHSRDAYPSTTRSFFASGFENPDLQASYRLIEQKTAPVSLDVLADIQPDLFDARAPSTLRGGTVASGGTETGAALRLNRQMKSLTLQLESFADHMGDRKVKEMSDDSTEKYAADWHYGLTFREETRFTDHAFLNAGLSLSQDSDGHVSDPAQALNSKTSHAPEKLFYLAPGYQIIPQTLVVSATYQRDFLGQESQHTDSGTYHWKGQTENIYALHLRYRFD